MSGTVQIRRGLLQIAVKVMREETDVIEDSHWDPHKKRITPKHIEREVNRNRRCIAAIEQALGKP